MAARKEPPTKTQVAEAEALFHENRALATWVYGKLSRLPAVARLGQSGALAEAEAALWRACLGYRPELGWKFSTYATRTMFRAVLDAAKTNNIIWVPRHQLRKTKLNETPAHPDVARALRVIPLTGEMEACIPAPDTIPPSGDLLDKLRTAMFTLRPRYALALRLRFVECLTLKEAGEQLGCTKQRVQQLVAAALSQLRLEIGEAPPAGAD
jgi:RNA polymerase sigma factor (sigma-70 family)